MSLRRFNLIALFLLLAALVLDFSGKSYASRAITTMATGGDGAVVAESTEISDLLTEIGLIVAACGGICGAVSIAKSELGPHWPMMLAGGAYVVFLLVWV